MGEKKQGCYEIRREKNKVASKLKNQTSLMDILLCINFVKESESNF
jgi:hypothetical protein